MDFLKSLFGEKALTYAELEQAINAHNGNEANKDAQIKVGNLTEGKYVSKLKYEDLQTMLNSKNTELETANNTISELKKATKGNEELQGKFTDYENQVKQLQTQLQQTQLDSALKIALLEAKASDIDYMTFKLKEKGQSLELGEDGKIKGIDDLITGLKVQFPTQFDAAAMGRKVEPLPLPERNTTQASMTKEEFNKMGYDSRVKLKNENPELYNQMKEG